MICTSCRLTKSYSCRYVECFFVGDSGENGDTSPGISASAKESRLLSKVYDEWHIHRYTPVVNRSYKQVDFVSLPAYDTI